MSQKELHGMCFLERPRSALAYVPSDQAWSGALWPAKSPKPFSQMTTEDSDQTAQVRSLDSANAHVDLRLFRVLFFCRRSYVHAL